VCLDMVRFGMAVTPHKTCCNDGATTSGWGKNIVHDPVHAMCPSHEGCTAILHLAGRSTTRAPIMEEHHGKNATCVSWVHTTTSTTRDLPPCG
jgi:hypothetical protein